MTKSQSESESLSPPSPPSPQTIFEDPSDNSSSDWGENDDLHYQVFDAHRHVGFMVLNMIEMNPFVVVPVTEQTTERWATTVALFVSNFLVSGSMAVVSKTIVAPIERTKLILQNQHSAIQVLRGEVLPFRNVWDVIRRVPKEQGILSFWRGNGSNLMRYFPIQALNFAFYDLYSKLLAVPDTTSRFWNYGYKLVSGTAAGATSALMVYPLELCQTRLAVDFGSDKSLKHQMSKREFTGLKHCILTLHRTSGPAGFYSGAHVAIIGMALYRGLYFSLFDLFKSTYWQIPLAKRDHIEENRIAINFVLAHLSTMISGFLVYPMDTVGRGKMLDTGRPKHLQKFQSTWDAAVYIYRRRGIGGFYKGAFINIVRGFGGTLVLAMYDEVLYLTDWKERLKKYMN